MTTAPPPAAANSVWRFRLLRTATLAVPLAIFAAVAALTWGAVQEEARAELRRTVDMLHEHALRAFETQEAVLAAVDSRVRGMTWDDIAASEDLHRFLLTLNGRTPSIGGIGLVAPSGMLASSSGRFPMPPVDLSHRQYVRAHRGGQLGTFVGGIVRTLPRQVDMFTLSRARTDGEGRADGGTIVTSSRPDFFHAFFRELIDRPDSSVALVREDGALLARVPELPAQAERFWTQPSSIARRVPADGGVGFVERASSVDGRWRLYAVRRVAGYPVYVVFGFGPEAVREAWLRRLAAPAAVCLAAAALLFGAATFAGRAARREREALSAARAAAEARAEAEARLRHAQRLEALGQLTGGAAHDVNNLLTVVRGAAAALRRWLASSAQGNGGAATEDAARWLDTMDQATARGEALTRRMLGLARRGDGPMAAAGGGPEARSATIELSAWLPAAAVTLRAALGGRAALSVVAPPGLWPVAADAQELEAAIINLVANARDAIAAGSADRGPMAPARVEVSARNAKERLPEGLLGEFVVVSVADSGPGMTPEVAQRAFEPFFTTKSAGSGTGLGLSQVLGMAQAAGGVAMLETAPGVGTTVSLWLPRAAPADAGPPN